MTTDLTENDLPPDQLPVDHHQHPHPESEQWTDPDWRSRWLCGLTDEELATMTPIQKGQRLPAYVWSSGYETYGPRALAYIEASSLFADVDVAYSFTTHELIKIGNALLARRGVII